MLIGRVGAAPADPQVTVRGPRASVPAMLFLTRPVAAMQAAGPTLEADAAALQRLIDALDPEPAGLHIVEP